MTYNEMTEKEINEIENDENFDTVYENTLNGIDPDELSEEDAEKHRQWVIENWNDINNITNDE